MSELVERLFASDEASALTNEAAREIERLANKVAEFEAALTPNSETKGAYAGEVYMGVTLYAGGEEEHRDIAVSWTAVKEIMGLIRAQAGAK